MIHDPPREHARPIEEMARAIYEATPDHRLVCDDHKVIGREPVPWEQAGTGIRELAMTRAKAALRVMRSHGWISDLGFDAIKAEERSKIHSSGNEP